MEHKVDRHAMRIICWSSLIITIIILVLQIVIRQRWRYHANVRERIFYWTLIAVYISHAINTSMNIAFNYGWPSCTTCTDQVVWGVVVYMITRMFTWLFLLQRALTAQGIERGFEPAVGPKWFTHYLPTYFIFTFSTYCVMPFIFKKNYQTDCFQYGKHGYCELLLEWSTFVTTMYAVGAFCELLNAVGMLWLFIKPIQVIRGSAQSGHSRHSVEGHKLTAKLWWNVVLSTLILTTTLTVNVGYLLVDYRFEYVYYCDRPINVISCFLMLGQNGEWIGDHWKHWRRRCIRKTRSI